MGTAVKNIIVSSCLVGRNCKYSGGNNGDLSELLKEKCNLIAVCPEQLGGLPTPRTPAEIIDQKVISQNGEDVTLQYVNGAEKTLKIAIENNCTIALLKAKSPSCGSNEIYDGTFSHTVIEGDGFTAKLLKENGIRVYTENQIDELLNELEK